MRDSKPLPMDRRRFLANSAAAGAAPSPGNRLDKNSLALFSSSFPPVPTLPINEQLAASAVVKADGTGQENLSHYGVAIEGIDELMGRAEGEPDFDRRVAIVEEMERKILTDLPLMGIVTLSYVVARNPPVDLGYEVEAGFAYWSLAQARHAVA